MANYEKREIFMALLSKSPVMNIVNEKGVESDGRVPDAAKAEIMEVVEMLLAGTEAVWECLVEKNAEMKK